MDIVDQLRRTAASYASAINSGATGSEPSHYLEGKAADEIARLRKEVAEWRTSTQALTAGAARLNDELGRLRAELASLQIDHGRALTERDQYLRHSIEYGNQSERRWVALKLVLDAYNTKDGWTDAVASVMEHVRAALVDEQSACLDCGRPIGRYGRCSDCSERH